MSILVQSNNATYEQYRQYYQQQYEKIRNNYFSHLSNIIYRPFQYFDNFDKQIIINAKKLGINIDQIMRDNYYVEHVKKYSLKSLFRDIAGKNFTNIAHKCMNDSNENNENNENIFDFVMDHIANCALINFLNMLNKYCAHALYNKKSNDSKLDSKLDNELKKELDKDRQLSLDDEIIQILTHMPPAYPNRNINDDVIDDDDAIHTYLTSNFLSIIAGSYFEDYIECENDLNIGDIEIEFYKFKNADTEIFIFTDFIIIFTNEGVIFYDTNINEFSSQCVLTYTGLYLKSENQKNPECYALFDHSTDMVMQKNIVGNDYELSIISMYMSCKWTKNSYQYKYNANDTIDIDIVCGNDGNCQGISQNYCSDSDIKTLYKIVCTPYEKHYKRTVVRYIRDAADPTSGVQQKVIKDMFKIIHCPKDSPSLFAKFVSLFSSTSNKNYTYTRISNSDNEKLFEMKSGNIITNQLIVDTRKRSESVIGWKTCQLPNGQFCIVKLLIPVDADIVFPVASDYFNSYKKYRCNKAVVIDIQKPLIDREEKVTEFDHAVTTVHKGTAKIIYRIGAEIIPDGYDNNPENSCTHGIHFHRDRNYAFKWIPGFDKITVNYGADKDARAKKID
jgi:hypothetical protein